MKKAAVLEEEKDYCDDCGILLDNCSPGNRAYATTTRYEQGKHSPLNLNISLTRGSSSDLADLCKSCWAKWGKFIAEHW